MARKTKAPSVLFGIFTARDQVETAVEAMKREGFRNADISILFSCYAGSKDFALETTAEAHAGATSLSVIGETLGWLAGIGLSDIPGLGMFISAGPLRESLADLRLTRAIGGLTGTLLRVGVPEHFATRYATQIESGSILFAVHADDPKWTRKARKVLAATGTDDVVLSGDLSGEP